MGLSRRVHHLDEVAYRAQAAALRSGQLTLDGDRFLPWFRPYLSGVEDGDVVFKYQPVWPAFLAVSLGVAGSTLAVQLLVACAAVWSVSWLAWEAGSSDRAVHAAAAVVALSPIV